MEQSLIPSEKYSRLLALLRQSGSAVLAFSGGVDSSFLLKAMKISGIKVLAVTAISETMPKRDRENCTALVRGIGADHLVIKTDELANESFVKNTSDRCFFCKDELFRKLKDMPGREGFCSYSTARTPMTLKITGQAEGPRRFMASGARWQSAAFLKKR